MYFFPACHLNCSKTSNCNSLFHQRQRRTYVRWSFSTFNILIISTDMLLAYTKHNLSIHLQIHLLTISEPTRWALFQSPATPCFRHAFRQLSPHLAISRKMSSIKCCVWLWLLLSLQCLPSSRLSLFSEERQTCSSVTICHCSIIWIFLLFFQMVFWWHKTASHWASSAGSQNDRFAFSTLSKSVFSQAIYYTKWNLFYVPSGVLFFLHIKPYYY